MPESSGGASIADLCEHIQQAHEAEVAKLRDELEQLRAQLREAQGNSATSVAAVSADAPLEEAAIEVDAASPGGNGSQEENFASEGANSSSPVRRPSTSSNSAVRKGASGIGNVFDDDGPLTAVPTKMTVMETIAFFVNHPLFEAFFCFAIAVNACLIAAEVQYNGMQSAYDLKYKNEDATAASRWPYAKTVFMVFSYLFGILFTFEQLIKLVGLRANYFRDMWNWFDALIVLLWIVSQISETVVPVNPQVLRIARLSRLMRLIRLARKVQSFDSLYCMTTAIRGSLSILTWTSCLLMLMEMLLGLFICQFLHEFYFNNDANPEHERQEVFTYFGTFTRAMFSMFELTLANWPPVSRKLAENVTEWFMPLCVVHKLTIGFAVVGVINGVFMQETFKVAAQDDMIMVRQKQRMAKHHLEKMNGLFEYLDSSGTNKVSIDDFRKVLTNENVRVWLSSMDLDTSDVDNLFKLIDDGDGSLTVQELARGIGRAKGHARSIDLLTLAREVEELRRLVVDRGFLPFAPKDIYKQQFAEV